MRSLVLLLVVASLGLFSTVGVAQSDLRPETDQTTTIDRIQFTDAELADFGFTPAELDIYKKRMQSTPGRWWGQLSPMELMMYSSTTEVERKRFARLYLESLHPKVLAERDAAVTMYQVAREIHKEQRGVTPVSMTKRSLKRPVLFVDVGCESCKKDVIELVEASDSILDIYVLGVDRAEDVNQQLIRWARSMRLPPKRITLNDDNGIYQRRYGQALDKLHLVNQ